MPALDLERGARRAERVVLVRDRDPERGHDRVAGVLLDRSPVAAERRGDGLEVPPQDTPERLGVERAGERHRLDDVDEEDGDQPAELHRRLRHGASSSSSDSSWRRIAASSSCSSGPGSMPSSSTSVSRAVR